MKKLRTVFLWKYLICVFLQIFLTMAVLGNSVFSQEKLLSVKFENSTLLTVLEYLNGKTGCVILYHHEQVKGVSNISVELKEKTVAEILDKCLEKTRFTYRLVDGVFAITLRVDEEKKEKRVISGIVLDGKKQPMPGATVMIKGTSIGVATDIKGKFKIELPDAKDLKLVVTFMGYDPQEVKIADQKELEIMLKEKEETLEDVVITGYANVKKSSFTGNSIQVKKEDILKISSRNVIDVLQVFDPSLRIMKNNAMGSDPNTLPEFYIRGRSGIGIKELDKADVSRAALQNNPNTPVFIMDGFEVSVEKVYDYDPNRIESITILKDAAATALYGSRAANGVIVIETKAPEAGKLSVSYNLTGTLTVPDISDYNLMNASEKLEAERAAGLYESDNLGNDLSLKREYESKMNNVLKGVDTDWISQPLRNEINHKHSIYVEGGSETIRFGIDLKYDIQNGVMKGSFRKRLGTGFFVDYRIGKIQIRNHVSYDVVKGVNSPYGNFQTYTDKMPYDTFRDEDENLVENLMRWHNGMSDLRNPIYEAEILNNFSKDGYADLANNLSFNFYFMPGLQVKGQFAISKKDSYSNYFTDPESAKYVEYGPNELKGELSKQETNVLLWNVNVLVNYTKTFNKHNLNASLGVNAKEDASTGESASFRGFPSGALNSPAYAEEIVTKPNFTDNHTRLFGAFLSLNYTYNDIYLLDASCRMDGSSEFGSDKKFAPFWSLGVGVNVHKYSFLKENQTLSQLKIRGSYGQIGKTNFPAYAAKHTYRIMDRWYGTGNGVFLNYMGNSMLTWEKTNVYDVGFDLGLFEERFVFKASYYNKRTVDLITEVTIPASTGFITYMDNLGEVDNRGFEFDFRADVYRGKDINLAFFGNLAHNKNKILKISESLKAYNERVDSQYNDYNLNEWEKMDPKYGKPFTKYIEGRSLTSLYGMKSLGINPMDGKEVYLRKDGTMTYDWVASDQVVIGDEEPDVQGAFGVNFRYRNFSLYATFMYELGGQIYNQTLVDKVENVDLYATNADKRALMQRWQKPGDITQLKAIQDRKETTLSTSRFIQTNNTLNFNSLSVQYDFDSELIEKVGLSMLNLQLNMQDVVNFSTIRQERGTSYPFARSFNFTLNASF